ncbi:MAG: phosphatidylserine decarboxylase [Lachnospiraceae bacterium]|nr:phosphatidylserine decarboxylase [Lachnospiraceae bacterium]
MKCVDRSGRELVEDQGQQRILRFLYEQRLGQSFLSLLIRPRVSKLAGRILDSRLSGLAIASFRKRHQISMEDFEERTYRSYNDFFTRRIKPGKRAFSDVPSELCAPCDSRLSVYPIHEDAHLTVKDTVYTMESLFHSRRIPKYYKGGTLCIFRLAVEDYHRYCYVDDGRKSKNYRIPGVFHTVNPLANDVYPIYKENTREFSVLDSVHFGKILMMEVGALMVGRIVNHHQERDVQRGEEKGFFEFGGSTVILCFPAGCVQIHDDILKNSAAGMETKVRQGETIGFSIK